jgi:nucleoside-diphosphate-sugar epimerase
MDRSSYFIVGGAGFIGGRFVDFLMADANTKAVTTYDSFSSGSEWHFAAHIASPRFIRRLGWTNTFSSGEALRSAMLDPIAGERAGRL